MSAIAKADALGNPFAHDPIQKAGQDPAGGIADGLATRATKGPLLVYIDDGAGDPLLLEAGNFNLVANTIPGDTLDVTDSKFLVAYVAFFLNFEAGPVVTEAANLGVSLEASGDGISWYPVGLVNRVIAITPTTNFRDDDGLSAGALSTTGGFASAATTQNPILQEDVIMILPAPASAVSATVVIQRAYRFLVEFELYVRLVFTANYDGPTDVKPPSLYVAVNKAAG